MLVKLIPLVRLYKMLYSGELEFILTIQSNKNAMACDSCLRKYQGCDETMLLARRDWISLSSCLYFNQESDYVLNGDHVYCW